MFRRLHEAFKSSPNRKEREGEKEKHSQLSILVAVCLAKAEHELHWTVSQQKPTSCQLSTAEAGFQIACRQSSAEFETAVLLDAGSKQIMRSCEAKTSWIHAALCFLKSTLNTERSNSKRLLYLRRFCWCCTWLGMVKGCSKAGAVEVHSRMQPACREKSARLLVKWAAKYKAIVRFYQKVYPPPAPVVQKLLFFWPRTVGFPCIAASWAAFGGTPGGGGGIVGLLCVKRAPASKASGTW